MTPDRDSAIIKRLRNLPFGTASRAEDIPASHAEMMRLVRDGCVTVRLSRFTHPAKRLEIFKATSDD